MVLLILFCVLFTRSGPDHVPQAAWHRCVARLPHLVAVLRLLSPASPLVLYAVCAQPSGGCARSVSPWCPGLPWLPTLVLGRSVSRLLLCAPLSGDGKCVVCDSYVKPHTLVRVCDECNYGSYEGRCVICGGVGISDAHYCKECTVQEKDVRVHDYAMVTVVCAAVRPVCHACSGMVARRSSTLVAPGQTCSTSERSMVSRNAKLPDTCAVARFADVSWSRLAWGECVRSFFPQVVRCSQSMQPTNRCHGNSSTPRAAAVCSPQHG